MEAVSRRSLNSRLFRWHQARRRPLLIREAADPWQVLVAEVMSQQTGIERVGPAWRRFVDRWPTPARPGRGRDPRAARGVGRARLQPSGPGAARSARGRSSRTMAVACRRPSPSSSAARDRPVHGPSGRGVAFGVPVAPLDVNVRRVVVARARRVATGRPGLQAAAGRAGVARQPGRWLDAVMDLASGTCYRPRAAVRCLCPLAACAPRAGWSRVAAEAKRARHPFPLTTRWLRGRWSRPSRGAGGQLGRRCRNGWASTMRMRSPAAAATASRREASSSSRGADGRASDRP